MLNEANVCISNDCSLELSHHYGLDRFEEIGATIINSINREYCKKFIIVFPGQRHPSHKHEKKEETFEMLWGDLEVQLDDEIMQLKPGDSVLVKRNTWHRFSTVGGAIFEEISTTHYRDDSHYKDETISAMDPMERKTLIDPWNG
jgi:N-acetylneuraminate synthase